MLHLLSYLLSRGLATNKLIPEVLADGVTGLPKVTRNKCVEDCLACVHACPTDAITLKTVSPIVDRGACIGCNKCVALCPTGTLANDSATATYAYNREDLLVEAEQIKLGSGTRGGIFDGSMAVRVVSTGCSACDLEVAAANNPIFDMDRFGMQVVASPRFADALLITGPVPRAMHQPLLSCYEAMADPRIVVACGTCAVSGGVHRNGYAGANGVSPILPVDVFIPGCPPHPWQIILGLLAARRLTGRRRVTAGEGKANRSKALTGGEGI